MQGIGQPEPRDLLLFGREHGHDAADGRGGVWRVQGRDQQMPGLSRFHRGVDGLRVSHLADEHHVGVLAQRGPQAKAEIIGVRPNLALRH